MEAHEVQRLESVEQVEEIDQWARATARAAL